MTLDDKHCVDGERRVAKYVNDDGVLQYCNYVDSCKASVILDVLSIQSVGTNIGTSCVVTSEPVAFSEDSFNIQDSFIMVRVGDSEIWVEALKLCRAFGYANPYVVLENYVDAADKRENV